MDERIRVLRVIARLNMGGPAHHVSLLSGLLDPERYETLLLHGQVGGGEASLAGEAQRLGVRYEAVAGLRPELRPWDDLRALIALVRHVRRFKPHIVHTHTAKAGMLGRLAALLAGRRRPVIVHTYHGHVLEGYFGPRQQSLYRLLERSLARISNALIGVSSATVDDLVRLHIAPRHKFQVIPIGLDLDPFIAATRTDGAAFRGDAGAGDEDVLLTWVGRLVPIKRVDVLLRAVEVALRRGAGVRLAIVGDGELRSALEALARDLGISDRVWFAGYRSDMTVVAAASDVAVLSSDNEGTPVSLIEAGAAATPAASTRVGGVADVVIDATGVLVPRGDHEALGNAIAELAADEDRRASMGAAARHHTAERFRVRRLVEDIDRLYTELLTR